MDQSEDQRSEFESINDDCLREICEYLRIMDVVNMAATCTRLLNFAKDAVFPKKTKHVIVRTGLDEIPVTITFPVHNQFSSKITLKSLVTAFQCFGEFVENLSLEFIDYICFQSDVCPIKKTKIWQSYVIGLERCPYLKTLRFKYFEFDLEKTKTLQNQIEKFQNLNELSLWRCKGITNNWLSSPLKSISKINKLELSAINAITGTFLENFRNLSSFTIDFDYCKWRAHDVAMIFDVIGNSLEHLKIMDNHNFNDYESIVTLISSKLLKLKSLEFNGNLTESSKFLAELPIIKILHIRSHININLLMQTLSDNGKIEELAIFGIAYSAENENAPPLIFNKLQHLHLEWFGNRNSKFFRAITRAHMPAIQSFEIDAETVFDHSDLDDLLQFFESKKNLKTICVTVKERSQFDFVIRIIIEILKKPLTPKRPFLKLRFYDEFYLETEAMELLKDYHHLIEVDKCIQY